MQVTQVGKDWRICRCCKQAITPAEDEIVISPVDHSGHTEAAAVLLLIPFSPSLDTWVWSTLQAEAPQTRLFSFSVRLSDLFKHPQLGRQLKEYAAFKGDESSLQDVSDRQRIGQEVRHQAISASSLALTTRLTTIYVGLRCDSL